MGGKAIKIAERVDRDTFFKYAKEIIPRVEKAFGTKVSMVNGYHDKKDFGDLDLLILDKGYENRREIIENEFNPQEINKNSHLISFNFNELQVDLIFTSEENWENSKVFFDWGDLGNLMGKMTNNYGRLNNHGYSIKYGFDGLKCKLKLEASSKNVIITKDNELIFNFLGLSSERWRKGFNNREEMFDYVIESKYFDYPSFQWENLNSINKDRNKRRPNYVRFLEYIETNKTTIEWDREPTKYLDHLIEFFGVDLRNEMKIFKEEIETKKKLKKKFNGKIIMDKFPSLKGKELGNSIIKFKESKEDFDNYLLLTDSNTIIGDFSKFNNL